MLESIQLFLDQEPVQSPFPTMTERRMTDIVGQANSVGQVFIQLKLSCLVSGNLRDLQRMI